ncbi:alpha/beta-type small acid-soluble spore protein [Metabacillus litoralis]|uniref:alpha/beta-type small acid-soluble spore protein n=1 Tax=Metabacillus litoralis TaxID=152268 RepID=UPI001CFE6D86|nr:alpha/beta-type small acid-soluble spore protein [Metabacillus litoralis]
MSKNRKITNPKAKQNLDQLKAKVANTSFPDKAKFEVAKEFGIPLNEKNNGSLLSKDAGKIGGNLGGNMVREMIKMAEEQLMKRKWRVDINTFKKVTNNQLG